MNNLLLVGGENAQREQIAAMLAPFSFREITHAASGSETRRLVNSVDFSLVVINTPLPDEFGHELAAMLARDTLSGVLLLVRAQSWDEVSGRMERFGVMVLPKPLSRPLFLQSVRLAMAARARMLGLQRENRQLQGQIEEIRLIDRAKCCLIQYLGISEPAAHRYIEKQAMDLRRTKVQIAEDVLKTYES